MELLQACLRQGTSPYRTIAFARRFLTENGFEEIKVDENFSGCDSGRYFTMPFPDVLFAFCAGSARKSRMPLRMAFAHVDQPGFKLKGQPDFKSMGCAMLNVEIYGGMVDHTWFDRPLGLSGTVALRGENAFSPIFRYYSSKRPVAVIPGLAIHMNREMNQGWKINRQKELMPLVGLAGGHWTDENFLHFLAGELQVEDSEILSWDLNLYNYDEPVIFGLEKDMLCSPRLDNLVSVAALLESLLEGERDRGINLIGLFNHEEVGSLTRSGADSILLHEILCRILEGAGCSQDMVRTSLAAGTFLSVDGAHAAHPNYPDCADPTSRAYLGQGCVIKVNGSQKYASDYRMTAILKGLAEKYDIPVQEINDNNNILGGRTLGPMIGAGLAMTGCDLGVPMLSMHSARETMCLQDYESLCQIITAYFVEPD